MDHDNFTRSRNFINDYFKLYSNRDISIVDFFDDNFIGLDGISTKIYDKEHWVQALKHDYEEIKNPFDIKIMDFDMRKTDNGLIIATVISLWCIPIFENSPEFDKMRTVFVLRPNGNAFIIKHLSNSVSLLPLTPDDVYPTDLMDFLKHYKEATLGKLGNDK